MQSTMKKMAVILSIFLVSACASNGIESDEVKVASKKEVKAKGKKNCAAPAVGTRIRRGC